jgi:hypothetical protein
MFLKRLLRMVAIPVLAVAQYQPANYPVSNASNFQEETAITISPLDNRILFAGFNYAVGGSPIDGRATRIFPLSL